MLSLNTERTKAGTILTFDDGRPAGIIRVTSPNGGPTVFQFYSTVNGRISPVRRCHVAAEYDALAWAEDYEAM